MSEKPAFDVEPFPPVRRFSLDAGYLGRRRNMVHGLIEIDVSEPRAMIRRLAQKTSEKPSFTAFIIHCLSKAIEEHPHVHAYRDWRNRLIIYKDINISCMFEVEFDSGKAPLPHIFTCTNHKSYAQLTQELRDIQARPHSSDGSRFMRTFLHLPAFMRRVFYWFVMRIPQSFRDRSSSVMVTAVGMFGQGGGWAITLPNFTLNITVGGITKKAVVIGNEIKIREILDLTVSIDHDIVDGAPAARFVERFRQLLESGYGLDSPEQP